MRKPGKEKKDRGGTWGRNNEILGISGGKKKANQKKSGGGSAGAKVFANWGSGDSEGEHTNNSGDRNRAQDIGLPGKRKKLPRHHRRKRTSFKNAMRERNPNREERHDWGILT